MSDILKRRDKKKDEAFKPLEADYRCPDVSLFEAAEVIAAQNFKSGFTDAAVKGLVEALEKNKEEWQRVAQAPQHLVAYQMTVKALSAYAAALKIINGGE